MNNSGQAIIHAREQVKQRISDAIDRSIALTIATGKFASSQFRICDSDILEARESVCRSCEKWDAKAILGLGKCNECGCATWPKIRMASESCPLGKWQSAVSDQNNERLDV